MATVLNTTFAFNRDSELYLAREVTFATEVKPLPAGLVRITGGGSAQQPREYFEDQQRRNTFGQLDRLKGGLGAGSLTFPTYVKPSGAAGTIPEGDILYESWMGVKTINTGVDVVYSQLPILSARPAFTAWLKVGHIVYRALGCVVGEATVSIRGGNAQDSFASATWTCPFANLLWTGTDELAANATALDTTVTVKDAKKYTVGGYITIDGDDNAGAGYQITAVDYGTNILTITPGLVGNVSLDGLVIPWLPAGSEVGVPIAGRLGLATHGAATLPLLTSTITQNNGVLVDDGEKNNKDFADRIFNGDRTVTVNTTIRMDGNATRFIYLHREDTRADITIPAGNVAGSIVEMLAKNVGLDFPAHDDDTRVAMTVAGSAYESATLNDALVMTFK